MCFGLVFYVLFCFGFWEESGRAAFVLLLFSFFFSFIIADLLQLSVLQCFWHFSFPLGKAQEAWAYSYAFGFSNRFLGEGREYGEIKTKIVFEFKTFYFHPLNK